MSGLPSTLTAARAPLAVGLMGLAFVLLALSGVAFGSTWIPLDQVAATILGAGEKTQKIIVLQLRLPRVVIAALAGGGMAVAGFLLQKITRNSLASPGVLGVIDGAALGVVIFLAMMSNESNALVTSIAYQPVAAMLGAVAAISLVFILAGRQSSSAIRLLLFGIAVAAVAKSVTMVMMLIGPIYQTSQAARWIAGAVNEVNWGEIQITAIAMLPVMALAFLVARKLPPADLDEVSARGVGLDLPVFRLLIFALAAAMTALSVAFVGGVGFVGLMAPHLARLLVGRNVYAGLIGSFLLGAIMLVGADLIVRVVFAPTEVPAGTVTAIIGAPYFLFLLMGRQRHDG
ncbi:iron ABC transporter permease [Devosia limi DSM 17137]|uniref:Iron ABC transporter permease n=1 Tax=Devosia limi DSM 17137 TaxID=1121477 RepID=A0A0F5L649_9HYPH|nr:iron ABC transporter permease [Devosia limi]KKB77082.1 iron ABC transporter permease [Devosia limi DSM 17137]SHF41153.1 iron complex transport system permease protein [Devosia limi DSM 17137]